MKNSGDFDSILIASFGGPNCSEDVIPFLENVLRGRNVPRARLEAVAEHYYHFGGKSPINEQNLALIEALKAILETKGPNLPIYFGNRNWNPLFSETLLQMKRDGRKNALTFFTSVFSSYSGCRQYRENLALAQAEIGDTAIKISKLRMPYNHPSFIGVMRERVGEIVNSFSSQERSSSAIIYTAHSIPSGMAQCCNYERHFKEASNLVSEAFSDIPHKLAYQSRSASPHQPWLEPDISEVITSCKEEGVTSVIVVPIGFVSDHMEVLYDLDLEAKLHAENLGLAFYRAGTAGTHPLFVDMIRELIIERIESRSTRAALGEYGPSHDICPLDCCLPGDNRPLLPSI